MTNCIKRSVFVASVVPALSLFALKFELQGGARVIYLLANIGIVLLITQRHSQLHECTTSYQTSYIYSQFNMLWQVYRQLSDSASSEVCSEAPSMTVSVLCEGVNGVVFSHTQT